MKLRVCDSDDTGRHLGDGQSCMAVPGNEREDYLGEENFGPQYRSTSSGTDSSSEASNRENGGRTRKDADGQLTKCDSINNQEIHSALWRSMSNFLLIYNTYAGIALVLRVFSLIKKRKFHALKSLHELLDERQFRFRFNAVKLALFVSSFTSGYRISKELISVGLWKLYQRKTDKTWTIDRAKACIDTTSCVLSGALASLSLLILDSKRRREFALNAFSRALMCALHNVATAPLHVRSKQWDFTRKHINYLVFALSSGQIMYALTMHPKTLPQGFIHFIERTGPARKEVLQLVRSINRHHVIPVDILRNFLRRYHMVATLRLSGTRNVLYRKSRDARESDAIMQLSQMERIGPQRLLDCRFGHYMTSSCMFAAIDTFSRAAWRVFPFYISLHLVPRFVFHTKRFLQRPGQAMTQVLLNACRSSAFLATFVSSYGAIVCMHHNVASKDHKLLYYFAGILASAAIYIEPKRRHPQLALYVLPRALDSFYMTLLHQRILIGLKHGDIGLFAASMAIIMYFYEHKKQVFGETLYRLVHRLLKGPSTQAHKQPESVRIMATSSRQMTNVQ